VENDLQLRGSYESSPPCTAWRGVIGSLILIDHSTQKSPVLSGSFARDDLQFKVSYETSPPWAAWSCVYTCVCVCIHVCIYVNSYKYTFDVEGAHDCVT